MSYTVCQSTVTIPVQEDFNFEAEVDKLVNEIFTYSRSDYPHDGKLSQLFEDVVDEFCDEDKNDIQSIIEEMLTYKPVAVDNIRSPEDNVIEVTFASEDNSMTVGEFLQVYFAKFMRTPYAIETNITTDSREGTCAYSNLLTPDGKFESVTKFIADNFVAA